MAIGGFSGMFPTVKKPENRSQILAMVLENMQREAKRPNPQSWAETGARALTQGLQGYMANNALSKNEADEQRQREMLAGLLEGNPQAAQLLQSGVGDMSSWENAILKQAFKEPEKPEAPTVKEFYTDTGQKIKRQWNPDTGDWDDVGGARVDSPLVQIDQKGETAFRKKRGEQVAEKVGELENQVDASRALLRDYETVGKLLSDPNVYTGTAGESINALKRAGKTLFGMEMEGVAEAEVAKKVGSAAVGKIRKIVGDDRMSDADRVFYQDILPNLGTSPEGVQLSVEVARQATEALAVREAKLAELVEKHQGSGEAAWREFRAWESTQRIWSPELIDEARRIAKGKTVERGPGAGISPEDRALIDKYLGGQ